MQNISNKFSRNKIENEKNDIKGLQCKINKIVYRLYGLSKEEIDTIENSL